MADWASSQSGRIMRVRLPPLLLRPSIPGNTNRSSRNSHDLGSAITQCHSLTPYRSKEATTGTQMEGTTQKYDKGFS